MKVLLTGGSGNLGQTLVPLLLDKGDTPAILDVRHPQNLKTGAVFVEGSILNRAKLPEIFRGCDCIVHIAAWHGIHESRGEKISYDFFDLNVRGTFEVFEAAVSAGIDKMIFISTTSVYRPDTMYARSKILAELIAEDYRKHSKMNVIALRPRGFIPFWDRDVYVKYYARSNGVGFASDSLLEGNGFELPVPRAMQGRPEAIIAGLGCRPPSLDYLELPMRNLGTEALRGPRLRDVRRPIPHPQSGR